MLKNICITLAVLFVFASCSKDAVKEIGYGESKEGYYINEYFDLKMPEPEGWYSQSQEELNELSEIGAEYIVGDDKNLEAVMKAAQKQTVNLFAFFKHELGAPVESNPSLMGVAEKVTLYPGIKNGADYHFQVKQLLNSSPMVIEYPSKEFTQDLSGVTFDVMPLTMKFNEHSAHQKYYSARFEDYMITFIISYIHESELAELEGYIEGIEFN